MSNTPPNLTPILRVLHLDDDPFELERVQHALENHGVDCRFTVESVATVAAYHGALAGKTKPDLVILDIHVNDAAHSGVNLAAATRQAAPGIVILMCSTADDVTSIAECLGAGADDFISKQSDKGELSLRVYNSYRLAKLKHGGGGIFDRSQPAGKDRSQVVGSTAARIAQRVPLIMNSAISAVFIRGESGTGKEVVADLFGAALPTGAAFVKVNCGAIAPTLLESELFGHVKGSFTGAATDKRGLLEAASGGWIFLDEVATLSPAAQVALLRVLENQEVLRVGATKPVAINVRVLSATNEPMEKLIREGKFRADLWQRLRETEVHLPPLAERPGEIPALVEHFCKSMVGGPYTVSGPVMEVLCSFSWRDGNIRELRNCLRAMTEMHVNKLLTPLGIPERIWGDLGERPPAAATLTATTAPPVRPAAEPGQIVLAWDQSPEQGYDYLADCLLVEMIRKLYAMQGRQSLRGVAQFIGMSRSTVSGRLKALVLRNVIDIHELSRLVSISDK